MELALKQLSTLAIPEAGEDTSSMWWLTLKLLRRFGLSAHPMGKGICIILRGTSNGTDGIIRDNDARIESFLYDAKNVRGISARLGSDSLGAHAPRHGSLAFSLELYCDRRSYEPIYGFVPLGNDPIQLAKNFLFALQELTSNTQVKQLIDSTRKLESDETRLDSSQRSLGA